MTTKVDKHVHNMVADAEASTPGQLHVQAVGGHFLRRRLAIKSAQGLPQHVYYCNIGLRSLYCAIEQPVLICILTC